MPHYSLESRRKLATCHEDLQRVFNEVIQHVDCTISEGYRSVERQTFLYSQGRTRPGKIITNIDGVNKKGEHNYYPSHAVDATPWPIDYADIEKQYYFGGYVMATADQLGILIRWGGDWDGDEEFEDQKLIDLPHFEVIL